MSSTSSNTPTIEKGAICRSRIKLFLLKFLKFHAQILQERDLGALSCRIVKTSE